MASGAGLRSAKQHARIGYLAWTRLTRAATYAALLLLSTVFVLPFLWMLSASLKTESTVYDSPPDLVPHEAVIEQRGTQKLRVALYQPGPGQGRVAGEKARSTLDAQRSTGTGTAGASLPKPSVERRASSVAFPPARQRALVLEARPGAYLLEVAGAQGRRERIVAPRASVELQRVVRPHWENYPRAWTAKPFSLYTFNSAFIAVACILGQVLSASLVAFGFARLRFPGRGPLFLVVLSTMMLPSQVTMIPHYLIYRSFGWIDTFLPLIVPSFLGGGAFYIFLFRQFFMTLPRELDESARLDGASWFRVYWNILMPLCRPIVATIAVFSFIAHWNEFMGPLIYLNSPEKMTLALGLRTFQSAYTSYLHLLMAAATLALIPVLVLFFFAQKQFVKSIVLSGLKG
jgi:multiple sugar transport system permease protein